MYIQKKRKIRETKSRVFNNSQNVLEKVFGKSIFSATFNVQVATEDETILRNYVWKVLVGNMFDQVQGFLHVH